MTEAAALPRIDPPRFGARAAGLWAGAAALVLVAHVAVAYAVQGLSFAEMPDGGPPPALAIEMSPMVIAPAVQEETPVSDVVTPDRADPVDETIAEVKPVTGPVPEPVVEEAEPVAEQPVEAEEATAPEPAEPTVAALSEQPPPLEEVVPDIVETVAPDVVIPLPQPKPVQTEVKANRPVEAKNTTEKKPVEKPKQRKKKEKAAPPKTVTTASIYAKAAAKAAAPKSTARHSARCRVPRCPRHRRSSARALPARRLSFSACATSDREIPNSTRRICEAPPRLT